jgi:hypothetical protein
MIRIVSDILVRIGRMGRITSFFKEWNISSVVLNLERSSRVFRVGGLKMTSPSRFSSRAFFGVIHTPAVVSFWS